ncbi:MAG TPA: hypothetical protein VFE36_01995 [Candidatus Baltobacteraceae bacterium]|nr:hypothetical protein [Candidatus Baltobacteraceae bacterium]
MRRFGAALFAVATLAACGSGGSPYPAGWEQQPGTPSLWVKGPGALRQTYAYSKEAFDGTLQDLAQREIVNAALRKHGVKLVKSDVYAPCPGVAAIATFARGDETLQDAFAVENGSAVVVRYDRPAAAHDDPAAAAAMQRALCVAPA